MEKLKLRELGVLDQTLISENATNKSKPGPGKPVTAKDSIAAFGEATGRADGFMDPYFIVRIGRNASWRTRPLAQQESPSFDPSNVTPGSSVR